MTCKKTKLEQALECVVNMFHQYCILNPVDDYLQQKEFRKLMKEQCQRFLKDYTPPNVSQDAFIDRLFQDADKDKNGSLKFTEFLLVTGAVLNDVHERSHDLDDGHKGSQKPPGCGHSH